MKLRWIDLGITEPIYYYTTFEFPRLFKLKEPTIITTRMNKRCLDVGSSDTKFEDMIHMDKLPSDFEINRLYAPDIYQPGPILWTSQDIVGVNIHHPDINYKSFCKSATIGLRNHKIPTILVPNVNDCYYVKNGSRKKFCGGVINDWKNGWKSISYMVSYDVDVDLIDSLLNYDYKKFKDKGVSSIKNSIGGLYDYNPSIDLNESIKDIIKSLSNELDLDLYEDKLTDKELKRLNQLGDAMNDDWKINCIHPEIK